MTAPTITSWLARTGQCIGVERALASGKLIAVHLERRDGSFERRGTAPRWLKPGLWHERCALLNFQGKTPCARCVPSLTAQAAIAKVRANPSPAAPTRRTPEKR